MIRNENWEILYHVTIFFICIKYVKYNSTQKKKHINNTLQIFLLNISVYL